MLTFKHRITKAEHGGWATCDRIVTRSWWWKKEREKERWQSNCLSRKAIYAQQRSANHTARRQRYEQSSMDDRRLTCGGLRRLLHIPRSAFWYYQWWWSGRHSNVRVRHATQSTHSRSNMQDNLGLRFASQECDEGEPREQTKTTARVSVSVHRDVYGAFITVMMSRSIICACHTLIPNNFCYVPSKSDDDSAD